MTATNVDSFLRNMRKKAKEEGEKRGRRIFYTATFIIGKSHRKVLEKMDALVLIKQINTFLEVEKPEKIKIDLFTDNGEYVDMNVCEVIDKVPQIIQPIPFNGFGEAEINQIIDQRMSERQKLIEHEQLKEEVKQLTSENEELQDRIEELENVNDILETELATKKEIRYYAGMLGDILESIGIPKQSIKKPFAGLLGISENKEEVRKEIPAKVPDNSGIVEEKPATVIIPAAPLNDAPALTPEDQKRNELIYLISEYLKISPLILVAKVFAIFSDIESDNAVADELMQFLINRKEPSHDEL